MGLLAVALVVAGWWYLSPSPPEGGERVGVRGDAGFDAGIDAGVDAGSDAGIDTASTPSKPTRPVLEKKPPPKPSCNPPYVIDAQGVKRYKVECL